MAAPTREEKSCAYCGSRKINAGRRAGLGLALSRLTTAWASPDKPEIAVRPKCRVSCTDCGAAYVVQTIGNEETRRLLPAIAVQSTALANFKSIFPGHEWDELEHSVTAAVQPDAATLHIFLALGGKRAYLVCGRAADRFTMVAVEEAAG